MAKHTYATGCFLLMQTGPEMVRSQHNLRTTVAWQLNGQRYYAPEGAVFVAGAAVQWARHELELEESTEELSALAATVPDAGDAVVVPALTGVGTPYRDPLLGERCWG